MNIYFVYDGWDSDISVWEIKFYTSKVAAELELDSKIARLHEEEEREYDRRMKDWKIKQATVEAVLAADLPIPFELSWVYNNPPTKKKTLSHGLVVDFVEVQE